MKRVKALFDIGKYKLFHRIALDSSKQIFPKEYPKHCADTIPERDYDAILSHINHLIASQLTQANRNRKWPLYRLLIVLVAVIVCNVFAGLLLAYAIQNKISIVLFCAALVAFSILCSIVGIYSALKAPPSYPVVVLSIIEQINTFLDSVNQDGLTTKKPMWSLVGEFEEFVKPNAKSNLTYLALWGKPIQDEDDVVISVKE